MPIEEVLNALGIWVFLMFLLLALAHARRTHKENMLLREEPEERAEARRPAVRQHAAAPKSPEAE